MHHINRNDTAHELGARALARRAVSATCAVALVGLLAACGALIPPQQTTDPFGLHGTPVAVQFAGAAAALAPAAVTGTASGAFEFPDFEQSLPLAPKVIENEIRLSSAVLNDPDGPATITLSSANLTVRMWHGAADYASAAPNDRTEFALSTAGAVVLNRSSCTATTCSYDVSSAALGTFNLSGGPLSGFINVASNPPSPNQGQATLEVEAEQDELAGTTLTVVLDASRGTLRF